LLLRNRERLHDTRWRLPWSTKPREGPLEDIELRQPGFQALQIGVVDDEIFPGFNYQAQVPIDSPKTISGIWNAKHFLGRMADRSWTEATSISEAPDKSLFDHAQVRNHRPMVAGIDWGLTVMGAGLG
jgi:hypothetical protein